jgi:hypothetical protein
VFSRELNPSNRLDYCANDEIQGEITIDGGNCTGDSAKNINYDATTCKIEWENVCEDCDPSNIVTDSNIVTESNTVTDGRHSTERNLI